MKPILFSMPGDDALAVQLARSLACDIRELEARRFPDGESYVRLLADVAGRDVIFIGRMDQPDDKLLALYFAACTARELGARSVGLILPYLPYMRQDARFQDGEAITSVHFAKLLSSCCDWLVTVDPHLHRHHSLDEIYTIRSSVVRAAPDIARWIASNVTAPLIVGPDAESEQWVADVARRAACPYTVLEKIRHGDRDVDVALRQIGNGSTGSDSDWQGRTPVLVDDIISTARTMIAAAGSIAQLGLPPPICIGVHALFAEDAYDVLVQAGAARILTCNTVQHASNLIDVTPALAEAIGALLI